MPPRISIRLPVTAYRGLRFESSNAAGSARQSVPEASSSKLVQSSTSVAATPIASSTKQTSAAGDNSEEIDPYAVPPLSRPPGVTRIPSSIPKTWAQKKEELLDAERHKAKRKALIKEATQGYFNDYNRARKSSGGKHWVAPHVLIREDRSLYFPDISGRSLAGSTVHTSDLCKGKTTLLTILNTRISEEHAQSFVRPALDDWMGKPGFTYIQINHQPNPLKSMLLNFFISSLKRTIPEPQWEGYMVSGGEWSDMDITGPLGIDNRLLGYVFLIDSNLKIRWAGCGLATPKETEDLRRATAVLMARMGQELGNPL